MKIPSECMLMCSVLRAQWLYRGIVILGYLRSMAIMDYSWSIPRMFQYPWLIDLHFFMELTAPRWFASGRWDAELFGSGGPARNNFGGCQCGGEANNSRPRHRVRGAKEHKGEFVTALSGILWAFFGKNGCLVCACLVHKTFLVSIVLPTQSNRNLMEVAGYFNETPPGTEVFVWILPIFKWRCTRFDLQKM
jgi:hypothetical protein